MLSETAGIAQLGEQQTEAQTAFWRSRVQSTVLAFLLPKHAISPSTFTKMTSNTFCRLIEEGCTYQR
jgi:hypothetical protein